MASSSRKKTTMAKLNREAAVRERRQRKQARKDARKQALVAPPGGASETLGGASETLGGASETLGGDDAQRETS
jgi:hypothetical protein